MVKLMFEKLLLLSKLFVILPVAFGIFSSIILFIYATGDLISMAFHLCKYICYLQIPESMHADVVSEIIGAVDLYLIAIVLLIFSFGLYELFISEIDETDHDKSKLKIPPILLISSLDELKDKLAKVIVMVLVVSFFQRVLYVKFEGALEMMYFAFSISALSIGVYLLHKDAKKIKSKKIIEKKS
ncbi:YqhA family protein [Candidatus Berkiella cookevillensis]|uniref:YqhA family protein n=1 Tax=Candidatus Berkiella cookevillensis TaxID=437022 RepID=A0A0Q9Y8U7_9GAMM|nr:YqhA family protein [Candidatus Berkiella cookevillensis]MCS5707709.1 YqhA family protein [Candidatus Berkiella cookevillensis]